MLALNPTLQLFNLSITATTSTSAPSYTAYKIATHAHLIAIKKQTHFRDTKDKRKNIQFLTGTSLNSITNRLPSS